MQETSYSYLDSTTDRSLTRNNSRKINLQSSKISRTSRISPTYSCKAIQLGEPKISPFRKEHTQPTTQQLMKENKKLKRQIDRLKIEVNILRRAQEQRKSNDQQRSVQRSRHERSHTGDENEIKRIRKLLELAYHSIKKIQEDKALVCEQNKKLNKLACTLADNISLVEKTNQSLKRQIQSERNKHKFETDLLWERVNKLEDDLHYIMKSSDNISRMTKNNDSYMYESSKEFSTMSTKRNKEKSFRSLSKNARKNVRSLNGCYF